MKQQHNKHGSKYSIWRKRPWIIFWVSNDGYEEDDVFRYSQLWVARNCCTPSAAVDNAGGIGGIPSEFWRVIYGPKASWTSQQWDTCTKNNFMFVFLAVSFGITKVYCLFT